jgi:hypothetical protein
MRALTPTGHSPSTGEWFCCLSQSLPFTHSVGSDSPSKSHSQSYVTTDGQSASLSWCQASIWGPRPDFYYCQTVAGLLMWSVVSNERTDLLFIIAAGPRQRSHSQVRVPRDSLPHFTVSDSRLPQSGGSDPRIYIPQEQGGPVIPPRHWVPFLSSPTSHRTTMEVLEPTSTGIQSCFVYIEKRSSVRNMRTRYEVVTSDPLNIKYKIIL